jgi:bifunctional UDP-N-acetylglucosamine pyrophosphorylase/glucosamine-1-phosphate N-acetyltransferase
MNAQNEYYLPDVIGILAHGGERVEAIPVDDPFLTFGINTSEDLIAATRELQQRIKRNVEQQGDPPGSPARSYPD